MGTKSYRIVYNVHCMHLNIYDKETIVKNCDDEFEAKTKLANHCKKRYQGFDAIEVRSCKRELVDSTRNDFDDITKLPKKEANKLMEMFNEFINKNK